jgi:hypothetical protein
MSYSFSRFGNIILPAYNRESVTSPVAPAQRIITTTAGAFDSDSSQRATQRFPHALSIDAIVYESDVAVQRSEIDILRAAVGTRAFLYREADDDGVTHRALCRLNNMVINRSHTQRRTFQPVTLQFLQLMAWQGGNHTEWTLDSGESLDDALFFDVVDYTWSIGTSPTTQTVNNAGNLPVRNVVFTITAGATALTNPKISGAGMDLWYTGTIAAGKSFVVDCGSLSVLNDGVDAYANLELGTGHTIEHWCNLPPGNTSIELEISGTTTGATWSVAFRDGWA